MYECTSTEMTVPRRTNARDPLADILELSPSPDGLGGYLANALRGVVDLFEAHHATVFIREPNSSHFELAAVQGPQAVVPAQASFDLGEGIAGAAAEEGEPMIVDDPELHPTLSTRRAKGRGNVGSSMVVPLLLSGVCIGVLNIARAPQKPSFDRNALRKARAVAQHLALAVNNAALVDRISSALADAESLRASRDILFESLEAGLIALEGTEKVELNPAVLSMLRWTGPAPATWRGLLRKLPHYWKHALTLARRAALQGTSARTTVHDGQESRYWSLTASAVPNRGAVIVVHDTTEIELERQDSERTKRMAEIGQMAAAIAHEIRNPLTSILASAQVIRDVSEASAEFASVIETEVRKLDRLCGDFLEFSKSLRLEVSRVDLLKLAHQVIQSELPRSVEAGVKLALISEARSPKILADPLRVEQVLRNLVLNAIDACQPGDSVEVELAEWGFEVRDTGAGMSPETVGKLFMPFFTTKAKGTGLGLSNVRKIVDAHGGTVEVESELGKGSTFRVRLKKD